MTKMYSIKNSQALNLGNTYTYTILAADRLAYRGFMLTAAGAVTISDGVDSILLTLDANEEAPLNNSATTIVGTADNTIVFLY